MRLKSAEEKKSMIIEADTMDECHVSHITLFVKNDLSKEYNNLHVRVYNERNSCTTKIFSYIYFILSFISYRPQVENVPVLTSEQF